MKTKIWNILSWIDNNINHEYIDPLTNYFSLEDKDGNDSLLYKIYENTSIAYCHFVNIYLHDLWKIDDE